MTTNRRPQQATPLAAPVDLDNNTPPVDLRALQRTIRATYGESDRARGVEAGLAWFIEEVGELSRAIRRQDHAQRVEEFSDVLAWLLSLADMAGVDLAAAAQQRYGTGCPRCEASPCACT